ncbi:ZIP family metal transporter [Nonlabens tegetincola]|uniref:ZIP family metal transporter n=1 Tax=Nonlabens tegetincola TaxID=323273 RepID=UPI000A203573|nr:ZIP family metal transporter [Nonlabens tegetincola]ARN71459.1 ZIP family metal transporter [Nonlabens tegetincola]
MIPIFLPFIAVVLGFFAAMALKNINSNSIKLVLAFSGAFLLSTTVHEFLPEVFEDGSRYGVYIVIGVFIQIILEFFSKGAEHGHLHINKEVPSFPTALFVSLCIHAFLEGIPLNASQSMVYGIAVHKIPIAFIFSSFLLQQGYGVFKSAFLVFIFALMSPLGTLLNEYILFDDELVTIIKAIVAGIVLHVSTTLILEASEAHKFNLAKMLVMIIGAAMGLLL